MAFILGFTAATAADQVVVERGGEQITLIGNVIAKSQDGGVLFQTRDGRLWPLQPDQISEHQEDDEAVQPLTRKNLGRQIRAELNRDFGDDFKIHEADKFVIVYNTHKDYARWVGGLYRRFERGFNNYWRTRDFKPHDPQFPLSVIVFKSRRQFHQYMQRELGTVNPEMIAYYNMETNRVTMYDLTADELAGQPIDQRRIQQVLSNPRAIPMVATIIHEGTHQLMFNLGMQTRFSDTPLWLNEGMAMYFEVPDLSSKNGWRKIGQINFLRMGPLLHYFRRRPADALKSMIMFDKPFRGPAALDMYAQAWAFNYFLLNQHQDEFVEYLKFMSNKPRLQYDSPEQRLADFIQFFDIDLEQLDEEFVEFMRSRNQYGH